MTEGLITLYNLQDAGSHAFSIGITEVLNSNLLIELRADDIEYVYQRLVLVVSCSLSLSLYLFDDERKWMI